MCGICGFVSKKIVTKKQLRKMNDTMYHRGPDDSGEEIFGLKDGYLLGLGHRRLSIIDLSLSGHQPMHSGNGRVSIVFNGEIYNFRELRKELKDYTFGSGSDTEVIIAAYLKWGIDCVSKLNGMFVMAIFDHLEETLYLVRDRIGKKPLYYWACEGNLVFASECKAILAYPYFEKEINKDVIGGYMYHQYIHAPNTIYKNVYHLEPATILRFQYGQISKRKYWDVIGLYKKNVGTLNESYDEAKEHLKKLLIDSIRKRMIADVPYGCFLSGGYDSSLITAIAQSIADKPIKTFCIGFTDSGSNEAPYAKQIAEYLGTKHTELYMNDDEMFNLIDSIPQYYDEPFADSSQVPTMLVSKLAREEVTVVLSGDGGDELFCGYSIYEYLNKCQKIDAIGSIVYFLLKGQNKFWDFVPYKIKKIALNRDIKTKTQYNSIDYVNLIEKLLLRKSHQNILYDESRYYEKNWQIRRMLLDQETYLPDDILCKVDRASMKYSLETRCPFLDYNIIEYSYQLPHKFKYQFKTLKKILKDIAYEYIPVELLNRPKHGFGVPLETWLKGKLKQRLLDMSNIDLLKDQGIFDPQAMHAFISDYLDQKDDRRINSSRIIWSFFVFQQWYMTYMG